MARRKKATKTESPAPPTRSSDRHKPGTRKSVSLPPDVYDDLARFAEASGRPINWQLKLIVIDALVAAGFRQRKPAPA